MYTLGEIKTLKKNELKELALELGLSTRGLRSELEERIRLHLESTESIEAEPPSPGKTTPRRSVRKKSIGNSRTKSRKDSIPSPPNGDRPSSDEENQSVSSESESKQEISVNATFRTPTTSDIENTESSNPRNDRISRIKAVHIFLLQLRKNISNSRTFCKAVIYFELAVFLYTTIDWNYKIAIEDLDYDIYLPDFTIIMQWLQFWRPLISFIFYLFLLPLGLSYIFNFEPQRHVHSPLTFSVAQYAVFAVSSSLNFDWTEDVRYHFTERVIYVGAGTGAIFALYESILLGNQ